MHSRSAHPRIAAIAALLGALATSGCADALADVSGNPVPPTAKLEQLSTALAARFTNIDRGGRFETARRHLVGGALIPSRVFDDTAVWNGARGANLRTLVATGGLTAGAYRFSMDARATTPTRLGDTRHQIELRRLDGDEYRWDTSVEFVGGAMSSADWGALISGLLAAPEGRSGAQLRAAGLTGFPRTSSVLARLFSIDTLRTAPGRYGATEVTMVVGIHPRRLARTLPRFAEYLGKYAEPSTYRFTLHDAAGNVFLDMRGRNSRGTLRYRVRDGALVSDRTPMAMPDSVKVTADFTIKVGLFTVGYQNLVADFIIGREPRERRFTMIGRREPEWHLPLVTERLIRTPLRRPFQGDGVLYEFAARDVAPGMTTLVRRSRLEVQESAMLRFLNGLSSRVMSDLDAAVEREESRYLRELFMAMQADARALPIP